MTPRTDNSTQHVTDDAREGAGSAAVMRARTITLLAAMILPTWSILAAQNAMIVQAVRDRSLTSAHGNKSEKRDDACSPAPTASLLQMQPNAGPP